MCKVYEQSAFNVYQIISKGPITRTVFFHEVNQIPFSERFSINSILSDALESMFVLGDIKETDKGFKLSPKGERKLRLLKSIVKGKQKTNLPKSRVATSRG
jgi:hypothetical protein